MDNNQLDIVSVEMGRRLKEAGWEWKPEVGDWYSYFYDFLAFPKLCTAPSLADKADLHLPRRRDLELALAEMGYVYQRTNNILGQVEFIAGVGGHESNLIQEADTPANAVALAWIAAKEKMA